MSGGKVSEEDLVKAFGDVKPKKSSSTKKRGVNKLSISVFILGIITLIVGGVFLIVKLTADPGVEDAEFLISNKSWVREDQPSVVWDFTEIGKGTLTTDNHLNNYEFQWEIDRDKLKIVTSWFYDLSDEFDYKLDQGTKTLTIENQEKDIKVVFKAQE